jgi:hypothetical protein
MSGPEHVGDKRSLSLSNAAVPAGRTVVSPLALGRSIALKGSGLEISGTLSLHKWQLLGDQLLAISNSSTWWIADWLIYGESTYQDRYQEAISRTSLDYQTLRNYAWVARRIELSRRRDNVSFAHHAEVAALEPPEQDYWLRKAEELGWSRNRLRREVKASLKERQARTGTGPAILADEPNDPADSPEMPVSPAASATETLQLRLTADQLAQFECQARSQNMRLDEWAICMLVVAARR